MKKNYKMQSIVWSILAMEEFMPLNLDMMPQKMLLNGSNLFVLSLNRKIGIKKDFRMACMKEGEGRWRNITRVSRSIMRILTISSLVMREALAPIRTLIVLTVREVVIVS